MPDIRQNNVGIKDINDNISNINNATVNLPWYVPGPPMDKVKIEKIKSKLNKI